MGFVKNNKSNIKNIKNLNNKNNINSIKNINNKKNGNNKSRNRVNYRKVIIIIVVIILFVFTIFIIKNSNKDNKIKEINNYKVPYEKEKNNSFKTANIVKLNSNIYGKINGKGDIDCFVLYNKDIIKKIINIYITDINISSLYLTIYDSNKKEILTSSSRKILNIKILPNSHYYLKIFSKKGEYSYISYNLIIEVNKNNKSIEIEPNNSFESACSLVINNPVNGYIATRDVDFYKFRANASGFYLISLNINKNFINFKLYSNDHIILYEIKKLDKSVIINPVFLSEGIYYLKISGVNSSYTLFVNNSSWEGEVEFNNEITQANEFSISDEIDGEIGWPGDIDYYKIYIKKKGTYNLIIDKNFNYDLFISIFHENDVSDVKTFNIRKNNVSIEINFNKGYYYLQYKTKKYILPIKYSFRILKWQ